MANELPFEGFKEQIETPLEQTDPRSLDLIRRFFLEISPDNPNPFGILIKKLTGKNFSGREATSHWRHILENKKALQTKLNRTVGIQTAAIDYFEQQYPEEIFLEISTKPQEPVSTKKDDEWIGKVYSPGYHLEKLKEEILRAKRYKHALSAIMLDIDDFRKINETLSFKTGDKILEIIVKIIKKTIRTVDILSRYSGDRFMLILPNTNKREAFELAERLKQNINERTKRIEGLPTGVTVTLSVGQCTKDDTSSLFLKRLETVLENGKKKNRNTVYTI
ncbi:MAG: diguanylate cyclase [Fibrobacter sp.]|nr:diguanylate cyclase [Fibrobacter sp.]